MLSKLDEDNELVLEMIDLLNDPNAFDRFRKVYALASIDNYRKTWLRKSISQKNHIFKGKPLERLQKWCYKNKKKVKRHKLTLRGKVKMDEELIKEFRRLRLLDGSFGFRNNNLLYGYNDEGILNLKFRMFYLGIVLERLHSAGLDFDSPLSQLLGCALGNIIDLVHLYDNPKKVISINSDALPKLVELYQDSKDKSLNHAIDSRAGWCSPVCDDRLNEFLEFIDNWELRKNTLKLEDENDKNDKD
jgi:hypothetical protein